MEQDQIKESKERMNKLREAADPLLKYLATEHHPHVTAIVTSTSIELMEGLISLPKIFDHIQD